MQQEIQRKIPLIRPNQAQLMQAWDKQYPTSPWECTRAKRIEALQGNVNPIMAARCQE